MREESGIRHPDRGRAPEERSMQRPVDPHAGGPERPEERPPHHVRVDWSSKYPNEVILRGPRRRAVALTFDDGPDDLWTPKVLDALARLKVPGTFFVVGQRCERVPKVLDRISRERHAIGNHSWNHANLSKLRAEAIRSQISRTNATIRRLTGKTPDMLRPPYGAISDAVVNEARSAGMKIILWNVDSLDWMQLNGEQVSANILSNVSPGSVILQHSAGGTGQNLQGTVDALPDVVGSLRERGYRFLTVPELLGTRV
ncbi:polysaccharide deacetylase family protein [Cohnella caldifontis]|uniref:polysaccharide deacetylase family protein n=1 Tax=Cohnella caldifontis TaxID=3027471 RepID=UPI0023ECA0D4|nr:polysaccharide deacetylase family protein [Cohnella sp. YIM B05605]